jgi:hypothetical protein
MEKMMGSKPILIIVPPEKTYTSFKHKTSLYILPHLEIFFLFLGGQALTSPIRFRRVGEAAAQSTKVSR